MKSTRVIDEAAALADALAGMKTGDLQKKYKIAYTRALKIKKAARAPEGDDPSNPDPGLVWEVITQIPENSLDDLIRTLDPDECLAALLSLDPADKFLAFQFAVQQRMTAMVRRQAAFQHNVTETAEQLHNFADRHGSYRATQMLEAHRVLTEAALKRALPSEEAATNHA